METLLGFKAGGEKTAEGLIAKALEFLGSAAVLWVGEAEPEELLVRHVALLERALSFAEAEALRQRYRFDLLVVDPDAEGEDGIRWLTRLRDGEDQTPVIVVAGEITPEQAVSVVQLGGAEVLVRPYTEVQMIVALARSMHGEQIGAERETAGREAGPDIVGDSPAAQQLRRFVRDVAGTDASVLLLGETGTGKELIAREIHRQSGRSGPFVPINCSAVTESLAEIEFFGHERGAFTDAEAERSGLIRHAQGGTLFLDEIGDMPGSIQAKLLRFLDRGEIRPVGSARSLRVATRIVSATNHELERELSSGAFRADLYYRLSVLKLRIPPLRERREDIPRLVRHFLAEFAARAGSEVPKLDTGDLEKICEHDWPGNIRELRNLIELVVMDGDARRAGNLKVETRGPERVTAGAPVSLAELEKQHCLAVLDRENNNRSAAARTLGISRKTLERKLKRWRNETSAPG